MKRRPTQLDEHPSPARIREMYRERTGLNLPAIGLPKLEKGSVMMMRVANLSVQNGDRVTEIVDRRSVVIGNQLRAVRDGYRLELVLGFPPRTKKNGGKGGFGGIRQREAYRRFRDSVISIITPVIAQLALPLPGKPQTYNSAAVFYVDRYGKAADLTGLNQGLHDALENAGVIPNDWQFRTTDGSRIVFDDPDPRIEVIITPLGVQNP